MDDSLYLNDKYELIIKTKKNNEYRAKIIYDKVKNPFNIPKDIKIIKRSENEITFEFEATNITFYVFSTNCFLEEENVNTVIYSLENLKLILKKLNYEDPIIYFSSENKTISLTEDNLEDLEIYFEQNIIIKNNYLQDEKIKSKYREQKELMEEYKNNKLKYIYRYKIISYNIKNYLNSLKEETLNEPFYYITSKERAALEKNIIKFINNEKEYIFPVVGPYGIGKSMTALIIQKNLFLQGIKSLYINLKYYFKSIPFMHKIENLMNECYYLCESEKDYFSYKEILDKKNHNDIFLYLKDIYEKITDYTNFLFIIDQYKKSYDPHDNIFQFPKIHIFLLSSINDKDVKSNIESILKKEEPKLKYTYLIQLINNNLELYKLNYQRLLKKITDEKHYLNINSNNNDNDNKSSDINSNNGTKDIQTINDNDDINTNENINDIHTINTDVDIKDISTINFNNNININEIHSNNINENNNENTIDININNKNETLNNILVSFGFLPRYISLLLNKYDNIFDLVNEEYVKIFRAYKIFFEKNNISNFENIVVNYITPKNIKNSMNSTIFSSNLKDICLKYVNFEEINKYFYLKFAFPLCKEIFKAFYKYDSDMVKFISDKENGFNVFESFLKTTLRCFGKIQIDGYFEVDNIIDLNLTEYYKCLNNSYFLNKSNILINQQNSNGKDFDFCLYKPDKKALILIQVKYRITNSNVLSYHYYQKNYSDFNKKFEDKFKTPIEEIYLLYFSSYYYNQNNKNDILEILNKKKINCLFFNVSNTEISFDFENGIDCIELTDSFILFPCRQKYNPQWQKDKKISSISISKFLNRKRFIDKKIKNYKENKTKKNGMEEVYYEQFLEYFGKKKLINDNIFQHLGKFIRIYINSFGESENLPLEDLYLFIFQQCIEGIDFSGKLGLVYIDDFKKIKFLDVTKNKELDESKFCEEYDGCCYAVGKYNRLIIKSNKI